MREVTLLVITIGIIAIGFISGKRIMHDIDKWLEDHNIIHRNEEEA